jgi:hypothetical protein
MKYKFSYKHELNGNFDIIERLNVYSVDGNEVSKKEKEKISYLYYAHSNPSYVDFVEKFNQKIEESKIQEDTNE